MKHGIKPTRKITNRTGQPGQRYQVNQLGDPSEVYQKALGMTLLNPTYCGFMMFHVYTTH